MCCDAKVNANLHTTQHWLRAHLSPVLVCQPGRSLQGKGWHEPQPSAFISCTSAHSQATRQHTHKAARQHTHTAARQHTHKLHVSTPTNCTSAHSQAARQHTHEAAEGVVADAIPLQAGGQLHAAKPCLLQQPYQPSHTAARALLHAQLVQASVPAHTYATPLHNVNAGSHAGVEAGQLPTVCGSGQISRSSNSHHVPHSSLLTVSGPAGRLRAVSPAPPEPPQGCVWSAQTCLAPP